MITPQVVALPKNGSLVSEGSLLVRVEKPHNARTARSLGGLQGARSHGSPLLASRAACHERSMLMGSARTCHVEHPLAPAHPSALPSAALATTPPSAALATGTALAASTSHHGGRRIFFRLGTTSASSISSPISASTITSPTFAATTCAITITATPDAANRSPLICG